MNGQQGVKGGFWDRLRERYRRVRRYWNGQTKEQYEQEQLEKKEALKHDEPFILTDRPIKIVGRNNQKYRLFKQSIIVQTPIVIPKEKRVGINQQPVQQLQSTTIQSPQSDIFIPSEQTTLSKIVIPTLLALTVPPALVIEATKQALEQPKKKEVLKTKIDQPKPDLVMTPRQQEKADKVSYYIEELVKECKEELKELHLRVDQLDRKITDTIDTGHIEQLKKAIERLHEKIEKLKQKYKLIKDNIDFRDFDLLNDSLLWDAVDNYKFDASISSISLLVDSCKEEVEQLQDVSDMLDEAMNVKLRVADQEQVLTTRDQTIQQMNEQEKEVALVDRKIEQNIKLQQQFIDEIRVKISACEIQKKIEYQSKGFFSLLSNALKFGIGLYRFYTCKKSKHPKTRMIASALLMNNAVRGMYEFAHPKQKEMTYLYYRDFTNQISLEQDKVRLTFHLMDDALWHINQLKQQFYVHANKKEYRILEYQQFYQRLNGMERLIKKQYEEMKQVELTMQHEKERNKVLIKRAEQQNKAQAS